MISILFDCETTGLLLPSAAPIENQPRIIEFAAILCTGNDIIDSYSQLIQPECPIPEKITKITGLTAEDLAGMPTFQTVLSTISIFFNSAERGIGHNLDFDCTMLSNELRRAKVEAGTFPWPATMVCTIRQYEHLYGRWLKQGELYAHFMGKPQAKAHRAMDDVLALHECLVAAKFFEEDRNA